MKSPKDIGGPEGRFREAKSMTKRIVTSVIGLPALIAVVAVGGIPLQVCLLVLSVVGLTEIYGALSSKRLSVHYLGYVFALVYYYFIRALDKDILFMIITLFIMSILVYLVLFYSKININDCAVTFFGFFYVAFLLSFVYLTREHANGQYYVWLVFISAFGSDTFALFTGLTFGRHKLAPGLSPKKTVEGAIGGVLGAALLSFLYGLALSALFKVAGIHIILYCTIVGSVGAVFAQFGDLAASAIKRYTGIKDFGYVIPGHGGVMDRFDSVIFTAPAVYLAMHMLVR